MLALAETATLSAPDHFALVLGARRGSGAHRRRAALPLADEILARARAKSEGKPLNHHGHIMGFRQTLAGDLAREHEGWGKAAVSEALSLLMGSGALFLDEVGIIYLVPAR